MTGVMRAMRRRWCTDGERGSAAVEAAVGVPAFLLFIGLVFAGGRVAIAAQSVQAAASEAARTASLARTATEAQANGYSAARRSLAEKGLDCNPSVNVNTSQFAVPLGERGDVAATVTCEVEVSDLAVPGMPGTIRIDKTMQSPIDIYRER